MASIWLLFSVETMVTKGHGRKAPAKSQGENPSAPTQTGIISPARRFFRSQYHAIQMQIS